MVSGDKDNPCVLTIYSIFSWLL